MFSYCDVVLCACTVKSHNKSYYVTVQIMIDKKIINITFPILWLHGLSLHNCGTKGLSISPWWYSVYTKPRPWNLIIQGVATTW